MRRTRQRYRKTQRKSRNSRKTRKGGAALVTSNCRENVPQNKRQRVDYVDLATRLLSDQGIPQAELTKNEQNDLNRLKGSGKGIQGSLAANLEKRNTHRFPRGVHIPPLIHAIYDQLIHERGIETKPMTPDEYVKYKEDFIAGITTDPRFVRIATENRTNCHNLSFSFSREGFTRYVSGLGVIGRLEPRRSLVEVMPNTYQIQKRADIKDENGIIVGKIMDSIREYTPGQRLVTHPYGIVIKPGYTITNPDGTTLNL